MSSEDQTGETRDTRPLRPKKWIPPPVGTALPVALDGFEAYAEVLADYIESLADWIAAQNDKTFRETHARIHAEGTWQPKGET